MTVDSGVWEFAKEFLIGLGPKHWFAIHSTSYQVPIPRPITGKPNRRIFVIDAPMWLYEFGNPLPGVSYPKTFGQLLASQAKKIEHLLADELAEGVVFLCDDIPPLAKQCTSARDPTENTPPTPVDLVADLVSTEHNRRIEAWVRWSQQPDRQVNIVRETKLASSDPSAEKIFDFVLPPWKPTKNGNPDLYAQMVAGEVKPPFMDDYLKNADFKKMLYQEMLEGLVKRIDVPFWYDSTGTKRRKWVALQGTKFARYLRPNGDTDNLRTEMKIDFREADTVIGHYMRLFMNRFDIIIESTDGDFTMCALMAMDDCVTHRAALIKNVQFTGKVYHVRHRWRNELRTQVIDVCEMWKAIHNTFSAMALEEKIRFENPVGTFVALSAMLTNDYVIRYQQIGPSRLYKALLRNAGEIFATGDLVHNSWKEPGEFKLNWETFKRLSAAVWTEFGSVDIDITKPDTAIAQLEKEGTVASKNHFSMALVKMTYANLTWCLRYFNTAGLKKLPHPNEFSTDADGTSIFGYVKKSEDMDRFGRYEIEFAREVSIDSLI